MNVLVPRNLLQSTCTACRSSRSTASSSRWANQQRSFFSLADVAKLLPENASDGQKAADEIQRFHARKILPYSREQLYTVVANVNDYASFIPFCTSSRILRSAATSSTDIQELIGTNRKPFEVRAELEVGFGSFNESFTSRVEGTPDEQVKAVASDSPLFTDLTTTWSFSPASSSSPHPTSNPLTTPSSSSSSTEVAAPAADGPTLLTIDLSFRFVSPLHRFASQAFMPKVSGLMVEAFERRCLEVYGKGKV